MSDNNTNTKRKLPSIKAKIEKTIEYPESKTKAYATVTIGGAFQIHNLRVCQSQNGLFVAMPQRSYQDSNGNTKYTDIANPISKEAREVMDKAVLEAYENAVSFQETEDDDLPFDESADMSQSM